MAPCKQTLRSWHLAGHASLALAFEFPVELLSLDGITEKDLQRNVHSQRLDEGTLLSIPTEPRSWGRPVGGRLMEILMLIAMGGPAMELCKQNLPCTLEQLHLFPVDWQQAWTAAGVLWPEEQGRARIMARFFANSPAVMRDGPTSYFVESVQQYLMEHRRMEALAIQEAWGQAHVRYEKACCRTYRAFREPKDVEGAIGDLLIPEEWRDKNQCSLS